MIYEFGLACIPHNGVHEDTWRGMDFLSQVRADHIWEIEWEESTVQPAAMRRT